ncbi:protein of unknown function [Vibrio tapetis subsp. tapetis]|uniref:Uncharacterized protein n=1 Tax=Vibrio tapetis subsp. tapetis TaxID=1671868 RepID=A0A2N8Z9D6_9VIBR|nr:protein of unknown function [Vibrio tapetis subsp. tapetis]
MTVPIGFSNGSWFYKLDNLREYIRDIYQACEASKRIRDSMKYQSKVSLQQHN